MTNAVALGVDAAETYLVLKPELIEIKMESNKLLCFPEERKTEQCVRLRGTNGVHISIT